MNSTSDNNDFVFSVINVVSIPVCLTAATLVFGFKLHKVVVYRLALYQVLAAFSFATVGKLATGVLPNTPIFTVTSTADVCFYRCSPYPVILITVISTVQMVL